MNKTNLKGKICFSVLNPLLPVATGITSSKQTSHTYMIHMNIHDMLGSFWVHVGVALGSPYGQFGRFGATLGSISRCKDYFDVGRVGDAGRGMGDLA